MHSREPLTSARAADVPSPHPLADILDRLLLIVEDTAPLAVAADAQTFLTDVERYRRQLGELTDAFELERVGRACVAAVEAFLRRSRTTLREREAEFVEVIELLRQGIAALAGASETFHSSIDASTRQLAQAAQLDDIRLLKQAVLQEVTHLQTAAFARQEEERAHYSRMTERVQALEARLSRAQDEASKDALTNVPNRGAFDRMLRHLVESAEASRPNFVLGMVDIDDFKKINDTHGHLIGDRIIMCVAQHFAQALRASDFVARYGGEEFALIMMDIPLDTAKERLQAIRKKLAPHYQYEQDGVSRHLSFTYSTGLAEYGSGDTPETLIARADEALYEAKRRGKDRIIARKRSYLQQLFGQ